MLFNSWVFIGFLAVVLPVYFSLSHRWQNRFLLVASYFFYGWWDWRFLSLLFVSTIIDYVAARLLDRTSGTRARRALILTSICFGLGVLGFFKYFNFFVDSAVVALNSLGWNATAPLLKVVLPVGVSFYTFQTMSYTIDVYRKRQAACTSFVDFALYVTYFPQLVAGPIERAQRLLPQIQAPRRVSQEQIASGAQLMLWGFVKKVAVADSLAPYADRIFPNPQDFDSVTLLFGVYCFALQIYGDFSGYSDIARGISRILGIELMENFKQPYFARNITEFWRRWHISLSTWLRDYLYIPLGGNRNGAVRQYVNLLLTMLLGGLWHGANWTFVVWGGLHGVYLAVHKYVTRNRRIAIERAPETPRSWATYVIMTLFTFHLVCLTWVFFRAGDFRVAQVYLWRLFAGPYRLAGNRDASLAGLEDSLLFYGVLVFAVDFACWRGNRESPLTERHTWWKRGLVYGIALVILAYVREKTGGTFIYFQF